MGRHLERPVEGLVEADLDRKHQRAKEHADNRLPLPLLARHGADATEGDVPSLKRRAKLVLRTAALSVYDPTTAATDRNTSRRQAHARRRRTHTRTPARRRRLVNSS